jgi:hypothetical protein
MTIFSILFFTLPLFSFAQTSEISGEAKDWSGYEVRIERILDPISRQTQVLNSDTVDEKGHFKLEFQVNETEQVQIAVRRYTAPIYAEPGAKYQITVPPLPDAQLIRTWKPGSIEYIFTDLSENDINFRISDFDRAFYQFYVDHTPLVGSPAIRKHIREFADSASTPNRNFSGVYTHYSIGEMKLSNGFPREKVYQEYLEDGKIYLRNPAWYAFFNLFYADYFSEYDVRFGGESFPNRMKKGLSFQDLDSLLQRDDFLKNDTLRRLVMLNSIATSINDRNYPREVLLAYMDTASAHPVGNSDGKIAGRLLDKYQTQIQGPVFDPERFEERPQLEEKPTLLIITAPWSSESHREKSLLSDLYEKYSEIFQVIEVEIEGGAEENEAPWTVIHPQNTAQFMERYQVYSIPEFYWMENGLVSDWEIKHPSEGLEEKLYELQSIKRDSEKFRIGQ